MDWALALTGLLMGLAGAPHCTAMCGPACAGLLGQHNRHVRSRMEGRGSEFHHIAAWLFHGMRVLGYAAAGGLAAAGVGFLAWAGQVAPVVRPLWTLLHVAALALGLWLAITAEQPHWLTRLGRQRKEHGIGHVGTHGVAVQPVIGVGRPKAWAATVAGGLWVVWPCGLLQSAVVVAGLANTAWAGAAVMAAFAMASALGLQLAPTFLLWMRSRTGATPSTSRLNRITVRLAGTLLAAGSLWALGHEALGRVWAYCFG